MSKTKAVMQITPQIGVDLGSRDSIVDGAAALVHAGELDAAEALLEGSEKLYEEGVKISVVLVMDVSGSMDGAGQIRRVRDALPGMLSPAVGEIPCQVHAALVCFGDSEMGDKISTFDFRPLEVLAAQPWPTESGGSPNHESHLEALMLAVGVNLLREGEIRPGSERLSPLPESGAELILVTDDEGPRTNRIAVKEARKKLPTNCRLTVVASDRRTWSDLLREGDRFVRLEGNLTGLLRPVQDAITNAIVNQAAQTVGLLAAKIQTEVAGLLAA